MVQTLDAHIVTNLNIRGGKPHIAGHRITVADIVIWHEMKGLSADEIATQHNISLVNVYAALAYYFDNQHLIEISMNDSERFIDILIEQNPSKLKLKLNGK
jgi:uncharacterized protein (DUF433 family)